MGATVFLGCRRGHWRSAIKRRASGLADALFRQDRIVALGALFRGCALFHFDFNSIGEIHCRCAATSNPRQANLPTHPRDVRASSHHHNDREHASEYRKRHDQLPHKIKLQCRQYPQEPPHPFPPFVLVFCGHSAFPQTASNRIASRLPNHPDGSLRLAFCSCSCLSIRLSSGQRAQLRAAFSFEAHKLYPIR